MLLPAPREPVDRMLMRPSVCWELGSEGGDGRQRMGEVGFSHLTHTCEDNRTQVVAEQQTKQLTKLRFSQANTHMPREGQR